MLQLDKLKRKWLLEKVKLSQFASEEELILFQSRHNVLLPEDMKEYFKTLNGTGNEYDENLFQLYSLDQVKNIYDEYQNWEGIPNYKNIVNTLKDYENYYVFANYHFHLFSYAIKLCPEINKNNDVLVICGDEYKMIADSFSEYIELYLNESIELQFNKEKK